MNQPSTTHHAVETWKLAHRLVIDLYKVTARLPEDERDGLAKMIRSNAVAVGANIVSGHARKDEADFDRRLADAAAALEETKYALLVARDLGYLADVTYDRLMPETEAVSERIEELRGRLSLTGDDGESEGTPGSEELASEETPALTERQPEAATAPPRAAAQTQNPGEIPFMPAEHRRTFGSGATKSVGSAVKDLWGWLRGTPGRVSGKDEEIAGRIWTEDAPGTPNYLDNQPQPQTDDELTAKR